MCLLKRGISLGLHQTTPKLAQFLCQFWIQVSRYFKNIVHTTYLKPYLTPHHFWCSTWVPTWIKNGSAKGPEGFHRLCMGCGHEEQMRSGRKHRFSRNLCPKVWCLFLTTFHNFQSLNLPTYLLFFLTFFHLTFWIATYQFSYGLVFNGFSENRICRTWRILWFTFWFRFGIQVHGTWMDPQLGLRTRCCWKSLRAGASWRKLLENVLALVVFWFKMLLFNGFCVEKPCEFVICCYTSLYNLLMCV